jgi:2-hydroxychromene-2-carboxylate isomerase
MNAGRPIDVDFYFGLGSRYSYLAYTQIARIEADTGCSFVFHPLSSHELMELNGKMPFKGASVSGQYERAYRERDALRWANHYGVPFVEPKALPEDHLLMAKACHAAGLQGRMRPYCGSLFAAVFADQTAINEDYCRRLAADIFLDVPRFDEVMANGEAEALAKASAREAHKRGAFGVPTFIVEGEIYWGNDRLVLLENRLKMK